MKKNNPLWILAIVIISVLLILNIVIFKDIDTYKKKLESINNSDNILFESKTETGEKCPDSAGGFEKAFLQIRYFYSDYCPWCRKEEPILQRLVKEHGDSVNIRWYNIDDCSELVNEYKISGVPTFVFNTFGNNTEYAHYGFIYEKDLIKLMCDITGGC